MSFSGFGVWIVSANRRKTIVKDADTNFGGTDPVPEASETKSVTTEMISVTKETKSVTTEMISEASETFGRGLGNGIRNHENGFRGLRNEF